MRAVQPEPYLSFKNIIPHPAEMENSYDRKIFIGGKA